MATSILKWYRLGKAKTFGETQKKGLSKSQTKSKKLKKVVNKADSLKILAYATASAIKRDGNEMKVKVEIGVSDLSFVEIRKGISETDELIK
jgi:hypothetical protein